MAPSAGSGSPSGPTPATVFLPALGLPMGKVRPGEKGRAPRPQSNELQSQKSKVSPIVRGALRYY